ncbi:MAG: hypothetical protein V4543_15520 [Bacteroidota bacterium]
MNTWLYNTPSKNLLFAEEQKFSSSVFWAALGIHCAFLTITYFFFFYEQPEDISFFYLWCVIALIFPFKYLMTTLKTRICEEGVYVRFSPFSPFYTFFSSETIVSAEILDSEEGNVNIIVGGVITTGFRLNLNNIFIPRRKSPVLKLELSNGKSSKIGTQLPDEIIEALKKSESMSACIRSKVNSISR